MYGENSGQLRNALGGLLRQHRIQQRLGGKGTHTVPETTTIEEREELGKQIRRYRDGVLTWCLLAVRAATPRNDLDGTTGRSGDPAEELRRLLTEALAASTAGLAPGEELVAAQPFPILESWRQAARAAALGEHDFAAGVGHGRLGEDQGTTVLKDAADIVRGLITLDRRYERVPGWETIKEPGQLRRAADLCAAHLAPYEPDYTVDNRGWQPAPRLMDGPALPGLAGVMQAQYNLLLRLDEFPDAHSLRVVMESQRLVAHEASRRIGDVDPQLAASWITRAEAYARLVKKARDLGGFLGKGNAAGQGAVAVSRIQKLDASEVANAKQLYQLDRLFARIDQRVCDAVEHGVKERLYFQHIPFPALDELNRQAPRATPLKYKPIPSAVQTDLIASVRHELRPKPVQLKPPDGAIRSRAEFEAAITHRPGDPGPTLSL